MFPVIPVLCTFGFVASALGLTWYESLTKERKTEADRLAADLALRLYSTTVDNLTQHQQQVVGSLVQKSLAS